MRLTIQGMEAEWRLALGNAPRNVLSRLRPPGFAVRNTRRLLGQWVGAPVREIRIAAHLVLKHPWYAVVDVLKHEMAHQIAQEVFGATDETAHGESFREACRMLGANPAASGEYPPLDRAALAEDPVSSEGRIMARIRKLLALADSPNRHEAQRAMAKAHELMAKHNVTMRQDTQPREHYSICVGEAALRHSIDTHALGGLLRDFYFVKTIWVPTYVQTKGRVGRILEINGARSNVQLANYVYDYVRHYIDSAWRECEVRSPGRNGKRDFALGVVRGFREVLERQTAGPEAQALMRIGDPQLEAYFAARHPYVRAGHRGRSIRVNPDLIGAGEDAGRRLVIRKGITHATRNRNHQLGR